jgi:ubiquinol-cytochrome c reductase cytochrome b subunit
MNQLRRPIEFVKDRLGFETLIKPIDHNAPPETTEGKSQWAYIFGFGILFSFLLQITTGIVLATNYVPSPESAYESVQFITYEVRFGDTIRAMHWIGASAMVILVLIHAIRVFLTASYKYPREFNWISGVVLLYLTFGMALSGQLLRWDQDGVWTVMVAANFAGRVPFVGEHIAQFVLAGETVSGSTLTQTYALHVFILPIAMVLLIGLHLFLVTYHGISELPRAGKPVNPETYKQEYHDYVEKHQRPYWPRGIWNELFFGGLVVIIIVSLAFFLGPRDLAASPDLTDLDSQPQPDWFIVWYYALISIKPQGYEEVFLVYLPLGFFLFLLILPLIAGKGERHPSKRPFAVLGLSVVVGLFIMLTVVGLRAPWVPAYDTEPLQAEQLGTQDERILEGARVFHERGCQYCHQIHGEGGEWGPDLTEVSTRMGSEQIAVRIVQGIGNMPAYQEILTTEELDLLVEFLNEVDELGPRARD